MKQNINFITCSIYFSAALVSCKTNATVYFMAYITFYFHETTPLVIGTT